MIQEVYKIEQKYEKLLDAILENEIIDISYEINDKYSFDFTKNYHTTEFFLNKMLYVLEQDLEKDINNLIYKGVF